MDSIGDFLYLFFIIAIGIFQWFRKQKEKEAKRRTAEQQSAKPPLTGGAGEKRNPLEDIFGEIFADAESNTPAPGSVEAEEEHELPDPEAIPEAMSTQSRNMSTMEITKRKTELWEEKKAPELEDFKGENSGLEFDLRKAVIYTAIMHPKFKDL